ncbi:MAG: hypothetical protein ACTSYF_03490 [Promethearchaeota archaeon]
MPFFLGYIPSGCSCEIPAFGRQGCNHRVIFEKCLVFWDISIQSLVHHFCFFNKIIDLLDLTLYIPVIFFIQAMLAAFLFA